MACRGCSSDGCSCSVTGDGVGITVSGTGTPVTDPYRVNLSLANALAGLTLDSTDCSLISNPRVPILRGDGTARLVPLPCFDVTDGPVTGNAFAFTWNAATGTNPGVGYVALNSGTYSTATVIYLSNSETGGTNIEDWAFNTSLIAGSPKGTVKLYSRTDPNIWAVYNITGVASGVTGVTDMTVQYVDNVGTFSDVVIGDIAVDVTPAAEGSVGGFDSVQAIRSVTGADSLVIADAGKYLRCANASPFSLTVPLNATVPFTVGTHIDVIQSGAGQVTIAATGGVTINATPGLKLNGQWAGATLVKVATDTWDLVGNLTS